MTDSVKTFRTNTKQSGSENSIIGHAEKLEGIFFPLLLCMVMMSAGLYIYTENAVDGYTVIAAVICTALFALFYRLHKMKLGGLLYCVFLFFSTFIPNLLLPGWRNKANFVQWFFSGAEAVETQTSFLLTFIFLFCIFFCSAVFYFTQSIYRSSAVILISLIPPALAVKVVFPLPIYYPVILVSINLILFIFYGRKDIAKKSITGSRISALIVYTDFAAAAVMLAVIIPKPSVTPYYEQFESFMNRFQFGVRAGATMSGEYNRYSGNADDLLNQESQLLYIINSNDPTYMKIQVFDYFDPEHNRWDSTDQQLSGSRNWQRHAELLSYEKLSAALNTAAETDSTLYDRYPSARLLDSIEEREGNTTVFPNNFSAVYVIAPLRARNAYVTSVGAEYSCRTEAGEVFTDLEILPANASYSLKYYSESVYNTMLDSGLCDISAEDYGKLLEEAAECLSGRDQEAYDAVEAFLDEHRDAMRYAERTATAVSPEIQALSDSLTAGLTYDYEKAKAIEQYFYKGGFIYSLAYRAPENSDTTEFFLFESKTGTCSDFASAFTLLARAAGLTVRYAEGFVPSAGDDPREGMYYITTENAHAYPEVYIPGAGWVRYEPTIADFSGRRNGRGTNDEDYYTFLFTAIIFTIGIGLFVLLLILRPKIMEKMFRLRVRFSNNDRAVKMLYNRHAKRIGTKYKVNSSAMTAEEISLLTEEKTGISLEPLSAGFTEVCYAGNPVTDEIRRSAYECYISQTKEINRKKKKQPKGKNNSEDT